MATINNATLAKQDYGLNKDFSPASDLRKNSATTPQVSKDTTQTNTQSEPVPLYTGKQQEYRSEAEYIRLNVNRLFDQSETLAVGQTRPSNNDLEARAERINKRFSQNGMLGLNPQTPLKDIAVDLSGLLPSEAKQLQNIYKQKYGKDLLSEIVRELPTVNERVKAFEMIAPERVKTQTLPLAADERGVGIFADPPLGEVVTGTDVRYGLKLPPVIRPLSSGPDFVRFAYQGGVDGAGSEGSVFPANYDKAGSYKVTFEVFSDRQSGIPTYYTYSQFVRTPEAAATSALNSIQAKPTDPELLLQALDIQIEMLEKSLDELKTEAAKYPKPDFFQMMPPQQKEIINRIGQVEAAIAELRTIKEVLPNKLFGNAAGKTEALRAAIVPTDNPRPIPLQLYAKPLGNNTWEIVDATNPVDPRSYRGAPGTGQRGAWSVFADQNNLPKGSIAAQLSDGTKITAEGKDGSALEKLSKWSGIVALGLTAAGIGSLFLFPPAAPFLFGGAAGAGAVSGGANLADRANYGTLRLRSTETALDILSIAGGVAAIGGVARLGSAAKVFQTAEGAILQASRVGKFVRISNVIDQGSNVAGVMLITAEYAAAFEKLNSLPPEQREKQSNALTQQAISAGALIFVGGTAVSRFRGLSGEEVGQLVKQSNLSAELSDLVKLDPGLQRALQEVGADKFKQYYDDFLRGGKSGNATSRTFVEYISRRGISTRTEKIDRPLSDALGISDAKIASLPARQLNEKILSETNVAILNAYKNGQLPRTVEAAIENVLNRNFSLSGKTFESARGILNRELNNAIGAGISNVGELKQVMRLYAGGENAANRGRIGNMFYQTRLAQGSRIQEFNFSPELWGGKVTANRRADELLIQGRRTLDIKTGYADGGIEIEQLMDYNDLIKASQSNRYPKLKAYLQSKGIADGRLQSHDYLFLANGTSNAKDAAEKAFDRIIKKLGSFDSKNVRVFYMGDDGNIYQVVLQGKKVTSRLIGNKLPN